MQKSFIKNLKERLNESKARGIYNLIAFDSLSSTNEYAKTHASKLPDFTVIVAQTQTAGKGRLGRNFCSLDGGVYMSILVRPSAEKIQKITQMTAVAVQDAIELVFHKTPKIKWVNDLYLGDKKVSGILCESSFLGEKTDYVVVGIGVNVYEPDGGFPNEISEIAGAINSEESCAREDLIIKILECFYDYFTGKEFIEKYRKNSYLFGKKLEIRVGNERFVGNFVEIDEQSRLVIDTEDGAKKFSSGEVEKVVVDDKNC